MLSPKFLAFVFGSWLMLIALAIANGVIRQEVYGGLMSDLAAHQVSTVTLMAVILLFTYVLLRFGPMELSPQEALLTGVLWTLTTIAFEFLAGHYVFGHSWERLLADYNVLEGRVWVLIPATTLSAPYLVNRLL